jgi:hypothetical protein
VRTDRLTHARRLARIAREVDHAVGRRLGRLRVLIDVRTPMNVAVLRPVWLALSRDPRIALAFSAEQEATVRGALEPDGQDSALISREQAARARWDLVITADAWNQTPVRRCRRRMQFFHGVAGKYDLDAPQRLEGAGLDRFDRVAFINQDRLERYVRAGIVRSEHAVLVGYPKADDMINGRWSQAAVRRSLGLEPDRDTVIYAPTFSTSGSLHLAGVEIVQSLLEADVNVIVKLHDRSMVPDAHHTAGVDWRERLARVAADRRFALASGADVEPFLVAADVLVTDHSTVGFEFALLDRPIIVYDAPALLRAARIDEGKWDLLRSMAQVVRSPGEMRSALRDALQQPSRQSDARRRARDLFASPGTATQRALSVVYELLDVTPLAADSRPADAAWSTAESVGR